MRILKAMTSWISLSVCVPHRYDCLNPLERGYPLHYLSLEQWERFRRARITFSAFFALNKDLESSLHKDMASGI